jgi:hypothetical protein
MLCFWTVINITILLQYNEVVRVNLFHVAEQMEALESILPRNNHFFLTVNTPIEMWCKHSAVKDRMSWSSMQ